MATKAFTIILDVCKKIFVNELYILCKKSKRRWRQSHFTCSVFNFQNNYLEYGLGAAEKNEVLFYVTHLIF